MAANTIGKYIQITSFGESHGPLIGGVIDGLPSGVYINVNRVQQIIDRRSPGKNTFSSPRKESDRIEIVSGLYDEKTTGAPLAFFIRNEAQRSSDYNHLKDIYRPSHAEFVYEHKYKHFDRRGGGRASARETAVRVAAGAICQQILDEYSVSIVAFVSQIGPIASTLSYLDMDLTSIDNSEVRCPDSLAETSMIEYLEKIKEDGDSAGGVVTCVIKGVPPGIGEPVFDRLQATLGYAMLSINAVKGFDYGEGFLAASMKGSEHNDVYKDSDGKIKPATNHAGGIIGGISSGEDIYFRVAFKPISSISKEQKTVDKFGKNVDLVIGGRHDVCIVPRAVPVVEAMAAMVILDNLVGAGIVKK